MRASVPLTVISTALVLLLGTVTPGCGGSGPGAKDGNGGPEGAESIDVDSTAELSKVAYEVTKVEQKPTLGDPGSGGARAKGVFVVVSFELQNKRHETYTFAAENTRFVTKDGDRYKASTETGFALGDRYIFLKQVPPGESVSGDLAYDIPKDEVAGGVLAIEEVEDLGDGKELTVDLGL